MAAHQAPPSLGFKTLVSTSLPSLCLLSFSVLTTNLTLQSSQTYVISVPQMTSSFFLPLGLCPPSFFSTLPHPNPDLIQKSLGAFLVAQMVKNLPATQETQVQSLGQEDPLEKGMATHSSISCLENPKDKRAWRATFYRATKSWTRLSD